VEGPGRQSGKGGKKGVKFNKREFLKIVVTRVKYRFVDFCSQRKGSVISSIAVMKILLP